MLNTKHQQTHLRSSGSNCQLLGSADFKLVLYLGDVHWFPSTLQLSAFCSSSLTAVLCVVGVVYYVGLLVSEVLAGPGAPHY